MAVSLIPNVDIFREQIIRAAEDAVNESKRAVDKFGFFCSAHEAYAVLLEEVDELWADIKANNPEGIREEALQVAAMALRIAAECGSEEDLPQ